jgi:hypothetical protein
MQKMKRKNLFSLVNLIGLGVFFFVLATAVFFFLRRAVYATVVLRVSQNDSMNVNIGLPMWYVENLKAGMEQKDIFGRQVISIVKNYKYVNGLDNPISYLTIKLLTTYDKKSGIYSYEGVPLLIGSYQNFKINDVLLRGVVHQVQNVNWKPEKKKFIVEGFLNPAAIVNQDPYVAETITEGVLNYLGDKVVKGLKILDSDGTVLVDVLDVKKEVAWRKFIYQDRLVEVVDKDRKKISLKMLIETEKHGDLFLFNNEFSLKVNDNFILNFEEFSLPVTITSIEEPKDK